MATNKIKAIQINSKALTVDEINTLIANNGIYQLPAGFTGQANVKIEFKGNEIPEGVFKNIDTIVDVKLPEKTNEDGTKEIAVTIGNNAFEGTSLNLDKLKEIYTVNPNAITDKKDYVKQSIKVDEVNKEIEELNQVKEEKVAQIEEIVENDGDSVAKEMLQAEIELLEYNIIYKEKFAEIETVKLEKELAITEIRMDIKKAEKVQAKAILNGESTAEIDSQISTLKSDLRVAKADKEDYAQTVAEDQTLQAVINNIVAKLQQLQILADEASDVLEAYETSQLDHEEVVVPEETYTITFYSDGEIVKTVNGATGTVVETPVVEKEGYTFNGWSIDGEHIVLPVTNIGESDITYIAKWTQNEQGGSEEPQIYTITFSNDGEIVKTVSGATGTVVETPVVEKEGYTFNGWSIDGEHIVLPVTNIGDSDILYIAKWTQNEQGGSEVIPEFNDNMWFKGDTDPSTLGNVGDVLTSFDTWTEGTSIINTKALIVDDDLNDHIWYFAFPQSWNVTTMLSSDNATPVPTTTYTITNNVSIAGSTFTVFKMNSASDSITVYFN